MTTEQQKALYTVLKEITYKLEVSNIRLANEYYEQLKVLKPVPKDKCDLECCPECYPA